MGQCCFEGKFNLQKDCDQLCQSKRVWGLVEMTCGLLHASYSLPKWQAVKLTFFASCIKSKVLKILTCIRQENTNEQYCDTIKDLLLPNTITGQKGEKPHTAGLDDTKILLQKSSIPQYHEPPCPPQ